MARFIPLNLKHGHAVIGGRSGTYNSWVGMKQRCLNPKHIKYPSYGGRGIKVCERWNKFANFLADMGERPFDKTLERLDYNGDYCKSNCIWADIETQNKNRRPWITK